MIAVVGDRDTVSTWNEAIKLFNTLNNYYDASLHDHRERIDSEFDTIIFHFPFTHSRVTSLPKWRARKILYTVIEGTVLFGNCFFLCQYLSDAKIVTPSVFVKNILESPFMNYRVDYVIPHQIDNIIIDHEYGKVWRASYPNDKKIILFNGSSVFRKGLERLGEAVEHLRRKRKDFIVVLHSNYSREPLYTPLERVLRKGIVLEPDWGKLDKSEVYGKMFYADYIIMPSHSEGFGLPVIEAMALSKPLITVNSPAINEIANENNSFFLKNTKHTIWNTGYISFYGADYDAKELADIIDYALDAKDEIEDKTAKARETAERYRNTYLKFIDLIK